MLRQWRRSYSGGGFILVTLTTVKYQKNTYQDQSNNSDHSHDDTTRFPEGERVKLDERLGRVQSEQSVEVGCAEQE